MASIEINGGNIVYEILGKSGDLIALTPGGRFSKEIEGLRPLAEALVDGGYRVLLWD
ncbi:MAG: alpha/beta hydrolase, partial [Mycobacterium sp.]|nr:alpha/beta hydrolase [Mycobacterium sp.]